MKTERSRLRDRNWVRLTLLACGITILALVYLFQRINPAALLGELSPNGIFIINRTTRLIINDVACFLIILAVFKEAKYLKIAFWVFLVEILVLFPLYLTLKLTIEGDSEISSPLLSQLHRLIVNPMLMILLIAGFFYQKFMRK